MNSSVNFSTRHHELAREEIEAYLQQNKRNAENLLASGIE